MLHPLKGFDRGLMTHTTRQIQSALGRHFPSIVFLICIYKREPLHFHAFEHNIRCHTGVVSLRNEVAAIGLMATSMERRLKDYPQTLAEDQALMAVGYSCISTGIRYRSSRLS